jgi:hypothetical protein
MCYTEGQKLHQIHSQVKRKLFVSVNFQYQGNIVLERLAATLRGTLLKALSKVPDFLNGKFMTGSTSREKLKDCGEGDLPPAAFSPEMLECIVAPLCYFLPFYAAVKPNFAARLFFLWPKCFFMCVTLLWAVNLVTELCSAVD